MQTEFELDMHPYGRDKSYCCYHIDLKKLSDGAPADLIDRLWVRVIANQAQNW